MKRNYPPAYSGRLQEYEEALAEARRWPRERMPLRPQSPEILTGFEYEFRTTGECPIDVCIRRRIMERTSSHD